MKGGRTTPLEPTLILLSIAAFCSIYSTSLSIRAKPAIDFIPVLGSGTRSGDGASRRRLL